MSQVFVIQNQHGHFFGKHKDWVDGRDRRLLYRTPHRDEAVNHVFEQSSKDIDLRASVLSCELDDSGQPRVEAGPLGNDDKLATEAHGDNNSVSA